MTKKKQQSEQTRNECITKKREKNNPSKHRSDPQTNPNFEEQFNASAVYLFDWNHEV